MKKRVIKNLTNIFLLILWGFEVLVAIRWYNDFMEFESKRQTHSIVYEYLVQ